MEQRRAFGPFLFDPEQASLLRDGKVLPVGQHGVALLGALLRAECQTVSREALIASAWPGTIVEDGNLTVQIAALRKLLGKAPDGADWIATTPRRGYRLRTRPADDPGDLAPIPRPSLVVLPFTNLSPDSQQDYLVDGIVEDLTTALSRFRSLGVVARNSSFRYKGRALDVRTVAAELGVRYVLGGSVRRAGDRQRVTAQLVDAQSGEHVWARNFDGAVGDIFDVQDRIIEDVAPLVDAHITMAEIERCKGKRPESPDVYDLYLSALAKLRTRRVDLTTEAFRLLMRALAIDPTYAPALAKAVWALGERVSEDLPSLTPDDRALCVELAERGLAAAAGDATVLAQCALGLMEAGRQYERGLQTIRDAVAANPNNPTVLICAGLAEVHFGDPEKSLLFSRRAVRVTEGTPARDGPLTTIAHAHIVLGQYEAALAAAEQAHAASPDFAAAHWMLITANVHLGRMGEARRWLANLVRLVPAATIKGIRAGQVDKIPGRMATILEALRLAGLPEA